MNKPFIFVILISSSFACLALESSNVELIKNFRFLDQSFASSGLPKDKELVALKQAGFEHVINLIPGEFSEEKTQVKKLGMTFEQVPVVWKEPTLENFKTFVQLMNKYEGEKVLVHCQLNYRASAFAYLYQVTQKNVDKALAKKQLMSVWEPEGTWGDFITNAEAYYTK